MGELSPRHASNAACIAVVLLVTAFCIQVTNASSCSEEKRSLDLDKCLHDLKQLFASKDRYWFGTRYADLCPPNFVSINCYPKPKQTYSIASRLFGNSTYVWNDMTRFLKITFLSPTGMHEGCGYLRLNAESFPIELDPLSEMPVRPYDVQRAPVSVGFDAEPGRTHTLLILNVFTGDVHGLYYDIKYGNLRNSKAVMEYTPMTNYRFERTPFIFLLFRQRWGNLQIDDSWLEPFRDEYRMWEFMEKNRLEKLVAYNWVDIITDRWAIEKAKVKVGIDNCVELLKIALNGRDLPFLPQKKSLFLNTQVIYRSGNISFKFCFRSYSLRDNPFALTPLGYNTTEPAIASKAPSIKFTSIFKDSSNFLGNEESPGIPKYMTLFMLDAETNFSALSNRTHPLIYWLVTDIVDGNIDDGKVILKYGGPMPLTTEPQNYYFFVYSHGFKLTVNFSDILEYSGGCSDSLEGRCLFDVKRFTKKMQLVGTSWFKSSVSPFVQFKIWSRRGSKIEEICDYCDKKESCKAMQDISIKGDSGKWNPNFTLSEYLLLSIIVHIFKIGNC